MKNRRQLHELTAVFYCQNFFAKTANLTHSLAKSFRFISGKGEDHYIPQRKGVRRWERSPALTILGSVHISTSTMRAKKTKAKKIISSLS